METIIKAPSIAKHFDSTWKARKRTKRCRECHKLFRSGDRVHGEYIIRTNFSGNTGNAYQKDYWYFWHIEHDRHEVIDHLERCCEGVKTADQIAKEAGYESHADFKTQMRKEILGY